MNIIFNITAFWKLNMKFSLKQVQSYTKIDGHCYEILKRMNVKAKLSQLVKHYAMKTYTRVDVWLHHSCPRL
jgi:hypothetical protein